jgi:hypothetical protein
LCGPQLQPERLGVTVPATLRAGDLLDVLVPAAGGAGGRGGAPAKVRVQVPARLGPDRSLEVDVWTARLGRASR